MTSNASGPGRGSKHLGAEGSLARAPSKALPVPTTPQSQTAAASIRGLDGAAANAAGRAAQMAVSGNGESAARRNAGRYTGAAVSGAVAGGQAAGAHGAIAGAAKNVGAEAVGDAARALGAGGTGYAGPDGEGAGSKAATGLAVGGAAVAAPAATGLLMAMALLNWLKHVVFAAMATALNVLGALTAAAVGVAGMIGKKAASAFMSVGNSVANGLSTVAGVTVAASVAPMTAVATAAASVLAIVALLGTLLTGIINNNALVDGWFEDEYRCGPAFAEAGWDGGPVDPTEDAHAKAVYQVLSGMGMPKENIAGILGNWSQESGIDPTAVQGVYDEPYTIGPRKQAKLAGPGTNYGIGLGQWTAGRHTLLLQYAQRQGEDWHDFELQLRFMADPAGDNPGDVAIFKGMIERSLGSPGAAAQYFEEKWERAGKPNLSNRIARAEHWYAQMQNWGSGSGPSSTVVNAGQTRPSGDRPMPNLGPVKPHVQDASEIIWNQFPGITTMGGYRTNSRDQSGHPAGLAVDYMVPLNATGKATGDAVAEFAIRNAAALNVKYVIWYQRIWNVSSGATSWRPMSDRGSPTQNHMDHPHISYNATGTVTGDLLPAQAPASSRCRSGTVNAGFGGLNQGGMSLDQAQELVDLYNQEGDAFLDAKYGPNGGPGSCGSNHAMNCVSFSVYFMNKYTSFQQYPPGNGIRTAYSIAEMTGKTMSTTPTPYSVGSGPGSGEAGHTLVVLGVEGDKVILGEAGYCSFMGRVRVDSAQSMAARGWKFVDVSDLVTSTVLV